jgi:membrane fusion protein, multidrug efflux system
LDQGELVLVNNQILQTTGSIQLKANFANESHRLWPGELVKAWLLVDTRHDGLTVPASVLQQGPKGSYCVYRKLKSGRNDGEARRGSGVNE